MESLESEPTLAQEMGAMAGQEQDTSVPAGSAWGPATASVPFTFPLLDSKGCDNANRKAKAWVIAPCLPPTDLFASLASCR